MRMLNGLWKKAVRRVRLVRGQLLLLLLFCQVLSEILSIYCISVTSLVWYLDVIVCGSQNGGNFGLSLGYLAFQYTSFLNTSTGT